MCIDATQQCSQDSLNKYTKARLATAKDDPAAIKRLQKLLGGNEDPSKLKELLQGMKAEAPAEASATKNEL